MATLKQLTPALGLFGAGLGVAQLIAPQRVAQLSGLSECGVASDLMRAVGARELACAAGILMQPRSRRWLWARLVGDAMDLALLGAALRSRDAKRGRVSATLAAVVGITALDFACAQGAAQPAAARQQAEAVREAITVNRSPDEVYRFWRNLENLPRVMPHLDSVEPRGDGRSHWRAQGPAGKAIEWDAELVEDSPNQRLAWRSLPDADVFSEGSVSITPAPGGRGAEVRLEMRYAPPGGALGKGVAKLFGRAPEQQVSADLRAFKQMLETGEIARSDATTRPGAEPARPMAGTTA